MTAESHPLPVLSSSKEGVEELTAQQVDDKSLTEAMRNGKEENDRFSFNPKCSRRGKIHFPGNDVSEVL